MRSSAPNASPGAHDAWLRWLPGVGMLRSYQREWLRHDIIAGLVLTTMLVPVGVAYAQASGVPGIYGLYATIVPLLVYALFGPSRILVLGPDSALAAVILAVVVPLSAGDPQRAIVLASAMAVVSGVLCVAAGAGAPGLRDRAAVQAHSLWLHERHRADGDPQSVAEAVWFLRVDRTGRCDRRGPSSTACWRARRTASRSRWARARWRRFC